MKGTSEGRRTSVEATVARALDKYGPALVKAQEGQAAAMADLAAAVRVGFADQREVLMAVRLLADRVERVSEFLVAMDQELRQRRSAA